MSWEYRVRSRSDSDDDYSCSDKEDDTKRCCESDDDDERRCSPKKSHSFTSLFHSRKNCKEKNCAKCKAWKNKSLSCMSDWWDKMKKGHKHSHPSYKSSPKKKRSSKKHSPYADGFSDGMNDVDDDSDPYRIQSIVNCGSKFTKDDLYDQIIESDSSLAMKVSFTRYVYGYIDGYLYRNDDRVSNKY